MDPVLDDFGFSRAWPWARTGTGWPGSLATRPDDGWSPDDEHEGLYRSERSYGRFSRTISLPPEPARHGRRLEVTDKPIG